MNMGMRDFIKLAVLSLACCSTIVFAPGPSAAEDIIDNAAGYHLFNALRANADLIFVSADKGDVNLDYRVQLEERLFRGTGSDERIIFAFNSSGFLSAQASESRLNSLVNQIGIEVLPLFSAWGPGPAAEEKESANGTDSQLWSSGRLHGRADCFQDLKLPASQQPEDNVPVIERNQPERVRRNREIVHDPLWVSLDVHVRHEANQDFTDYDVAVGSELTFSSSYLTGVAEYLLGLFRVIPNDRPRPVEVSVGYDYVTNLLNTDLKPLRDSDDRAVRLHGRVAWETGIFRTSRMFFLYDIYREFDAPRQIQDAKKDTNGFFLAKLAHPLYASRDAEVSFVIKYAIGELPPNFEKGSILGTGVSVVF